MIKPVFVLVAAVLAAPAIAQTPAPTLPPCSAKVTDNCMQTAAQEKRAMTGEQADKRDARAGGWAPNNEAKPAAKKPAAD
jgi:hypothetical protein